MSVRPGEGYGDADRLPWLETVEEEYREGPSLWRIVLLGLLGLAVIAAGLFGYFWFTRQHGFNGNGELIHAEAGDYKVKPDEPGGMNVEGEGDAVLSTSAGEPANAAIAVSQVPEAPVTGKKAVGPAPEGPGAAKVTVAVPSSGGKLEARAPAANALPAHVASAAGAGGSLIQLGAFPDEGGANAAWTRLSKRFAYLAPLGKTVERAEVDGRTVFRLRVNAGSNGQARDICGRLQVAGERCYVAN